MKKDYKQIRLNKMHHVAVICSDYKESKSFYIGLLGFKIIKEAYRNKRKSYKLDLQLGDFQLELFSFPKPPQRLTQPEAVGLRHIAFEVNDIKKLVKNLKTQNIPAESVRIDPITDKLFTFFSDPDGLPIEVYEK